MWPGIFHIVFGVIFLIGGGFGFFYVIEELDSEPDSPQAIACLAPVIIGFLLILYALFDLVLWIAFLTMVGLGCGLYYVVHKRRTPEVHSTEDEEE